MENLSESIYQYAKEVNVSCNSMMYWRGRDEWQWEMAKNDFSSSVTFFYNLVYNNKGTSLINSDVKYLKEIGIAYVKIALYYQPPSQCWYVNSVSAENAYYCLVKYCKETNDLSSLVYLFILLHEKNHLLNDKFKESWQTLNMNLPFSRGMMLLPSTGCAISACQRYYYLYVQHHILSLFYDNTNKAILVDLKEEHLELYCCFDGLIDIFKKKYSSVDSDAYAKDRNNLGKLYFETVFNQCETTLLNY